MQRRMSCALWGALLSAAVGCAPDEGARPDGPEGDLDGGEDAGEDATGGDDAADAGGLEVRRCEGPLGDELEVDFEFVLPNSLCPKSDVYPDPPFTTPAPSAIQLAPASDGSLWVLGGCPGLSGESIVLMHLDTAGSLVASLPIPVTDWWYPYSPVLVLDDNGDPWVAHNEIENFRWLGGRLQHYSSDLKPAGDPIVFEGWMFARMVNVPGRGFAFMSYSFDSDNWDRFGLIDYAGELLWTNGENRWGALPGIAIASDQFALAATRQPYSYAPLGHPIDPMNVLAYGLDGEARWMREMPRQMSGGTTQPGYFVDLKSDAEGNLFLAAQAGPPNFDEKELFVQKLSADGVPAWLWQLDIRYSMAGRLTAVDPATGRFFALGLDGYVSVTEGALIEIAADGESCHRHPYSDLALEQLVPAASGELFFTTFRSVGRFRPIDP